MERNRIKLMEMSQARKQNKTISFEQSDIDEIIEVAQQLEKVLNISLSQRQAVMYAIRQIKKKR